MRRSIIAAAALILMGTGCYHVTVISGAPAAQTTLDKPWQNSFVYGLVPPPELDAKSTCPRGVSKVETERSFLNGLVGLITWNIYTPMHTKVTCASGPVSH